MQDKETLVLLLDVKVSMQMNEIDFLNLDIFYPEMGKCDSNTQNHL